MNAVNPETISNLVNSINPVKNKRFLFYLPNTIVFNYTFFQFADTFNELINLFHQTIMLQYFKAQFERDIYKKYYEAEINKIASDSISSDRFFQDLNYFFKHSDKDIFITADSAYFGKWGYLLTDKCFFATRLRSQYRKWLYGLRFDEDIDLGKNPIELLEAIRFFDFLKTPVTYLEYE